MKRSRFSQVLAEHYLRGYVQKRLLGGSYIQLGHLLSVGGFLFEMGGILGRAFRDKLADFAEAYTGEEGRGHDAATFIQEQGQRVVARAPEARTITELFMISEMRTDEPDRSAEEWAIWNLGVAGQKLKIKVVGQLSVLYGIRGAGVGSVYPELFEELYVNSYANMDENDWSRAKSAGLDVPEEPPAYIPLAERERETVEGFLEFCQEFHPQIVDRLRDAGERTS